MGGAHGPVSLLSWFESGDTAPSAPLDQALRRSVRKTEAAPTHPDRSLSGLEAYLGLKTSPRAAPKMRNFHFQPPDWEGQLDVHNIDAFLPADCFDSSAFGPSAFVIGQAELAKQNLGVKDGAYDVFHLRRGDTADPNSDMTSIYCDTSVSNVVEYMRCASRSTSPSGNPLLLMTDETDQGYLDNVVSALDALGKELGGHWSSVQHLDSAIAWKLRPEDRNDNYLVYAIASHLKSQGENVYEIEKCQYTPPSCSTPTFSQRRDRLYEELEKELAWTGDERTRKNATARERDLRAKDDSPLPAPAMNASKKRCLRIADTDFDRWSLAETPPRTATEADCKFACTDESSVHHLWCVGYEFVVISRTSACRLFDDCTEVIDDASEEAVAASPSPGVAAECCLRHEDPDFDRYFLAETPPRTATEADCRFACTDEGSTYHSWCNTYEFLTSTPGTGLRQFTSTCRLYAVGACEQAAQASPSPVANVSVVASPSPLALAERCLRIEDTTFDRWFRSENRTATEADCSAACWDESSEHNLWCADYEFLTFTPRAGSKYATSSTCRLYAAGSDACGPAEASPSPSPAAVKQKAVPSPSPAVSTRRCMRVVDNDFDRWFLNREGEPSRTATEADCSAACSDEASEHSRWCVSYQFITDTPGAGTRNSSTTCQLFDDCSQAAEDGAVASPEPEPVR